LNFPLVIPTCPASPGYTAVTMWVPEPAAVGVYETEQPATPVVGPDVSVHVALGENVPTPLLVNVTEPVGVVGVVAVSLTEAEQLVAVPTGTDPGVHMIEVVVVCEEDGVVTLSPKDPELPPWVDVELPSPKDQVRMYGAVPPVIVATKLSFPPARRNAGLTAKLAARGPAA